MGTFEYKVKENAKKYRHDKNKNDGGPDVVWLYPIWAKWTHIECNLQPFGPFCKGRKPICRILHPGFGLVRNHQ